MRRLAILITVFLGVVINATAQERHGVPGFDSIVANPVEYHRILDKFKAGIERPSVSECIIAYYGFAFQREYTGSSSNMLESETQMQQAIMAGDFAAAYAFGSQMLETSPVSLSALYWTLFAATEIKEPWEVRNSLRGRYNSIVHVISLSGTGIAPEVAIKVINVGDMYTYATMELGLEIGEGFLWDDRWTELEVTPSSKFRHNSIFFEVWKSR
jgi:hypothetical protein